MVLPLPNNLQSIREDVPNLSLKYYKRADVCDNGFNKVSAEKKKTFFNSLISLSGIERYKKAYSIRDRLLDGIGITFSLTTASRLIVGIGYDHPTEVGFMFDWTSGLPVIPGSSLKGITLDVVKNEPVCCLDKEKDAIFGSKERSGEIIFFPAYPCLEVKQQFLELDIMTPHYGPYYRDPNNNPPADWYSPVPIPFLTVPEGIRFCFRLANRRDLRDTTSPLLLKARNILIHALKEYGVGAKTAVSYGWFR
ncbi:MAG: hypothetical protein Fur0020_13940 [Thermodesulfovibrionia bacterium]